MSFEGPFDVLGIEQRGATADQARRAYAQKLKTTRPEDDPEAFMLLRNSYENALRSIRWAEQNPSYYDDDDDGDYDYEDEDDGADIDAEASLLDLNGEDQAGETDPPIELLQDNSFEEAAPETDQAADAGPPSAIDEIVQEIGALVESPWYKFSETQWRSILEDERIESMDDSVELSQRVRTFVCIKGGMFQQYDEGFERPAWIDPNLLVFLQEHFGWIELKSQDYSARSEVDFLIQLLSQVRRDRRFQAGRDHRKAVTTHTYGKSGGMSAWGAIWRFLVVMYLISTVARFFFE